jgi:penicillin-binding protein 1A
MVGGRDFEKSKVNLALSHERQPGSSFKTFVFAAAIENGMSPYKKFSSAPATIRISEDDIWNVNNYRTYRLSSSRASSILCSPSNNGGYAAKVADLAMRMGISVPMAPNPQLL